MSFENYVDRVVNGIHVEVYKASVCDVAIDGEWVFFNIPLSNIQFELLRYFLKKLPETERTTENVMKIYFDVQLLVDICRQEFED